MKMKFWHATNAALDSEKLASLRQGLRSHAIEPNFPQTGQKRGVFVWLGRDIALDYAADYLLKKSFADAHPVVLESVTDVNFGDWDYDYELGGGAFVRAYANLSDRLTQDMFEGIKITLGDGSVISVQNIQILSEEDFLHTENFSDINHKMVILCTQTSPDGKVEEDVTLEFSDPAEVSDVIGFEGSAILQEIGDRVRRHYPSEFDEQLAKAMTDNEFVYLEYPFKYIGSEPLPVTQTYVLGDFDWEVLET